ncbi:putative B3 domain-containing protein At3g24850 isoform X2 [Raphanus sativus]|nr:putative B3 domain-containing protein At3g24850 isoform X2 [Raphanus sativus]
MKRIFDLFKRKPRSSVKKPLQNPNGASTSSSSHLFDLNKIPSEKTKNPPNPSSLSSSSSSCLTENNTSSRKRRAVQEGKRSFKKPKVSTLFTWEGKDTPDWMLQLMRDTKGAQDPMLIFEKTLFETDVKPSQSRLSIPFHKLIRNDFLTPAESRIIEEDINNREKMGLGAVLVDQGTKKWGVFLKRWEMNGSWNYALVCGWNDVVKANGLKYGDSISLWSFRCRGVLCFALVPLPM